MLKEVGASGLISLGKKYAGTTFYVIAHPGGGGPSFPQSSARTARRNSHANGR